MIKWALTTLYNVDYIIFRTIVNITLYLSAKQIIKSA